MFRRKVLDFCQDTGLDLNRKIFDFGSLRYRYHDTSVARPTQVGLYSSITSGVEKVGLGDAAPPIQYII